ncbi:hypothetical protein CC78DRAFT_60568 [Lojkania enalia]|uniref:Ankyrin repeat protein n=1 Tax=Lojkania enalia TaxID=147567 RepID=A0A9P4N2Q6_9PLEO|nr:hypothetical protein CC78DRAFT_60568 [Didymosphaeria enalia]
MPNMSGPLWDVMTTLRSQADDSVASAYWGFALTSAARDGRLDPLRQLLDTNVDEETFYSNGNKSSSVSAKAKPSSRKLEARIGPIFSAITPALQSSNSDVVLALLTRLLDVLTSLQKEATCYLGADIHQIIVHDIRDSPFCKLPWHQSSLYLAVLAGYLRTAQLAAHGIIETGKASPQSDPLRMVRFGWSKEGLDEDVNGAQPPDTDPLTFGLGVRRTISIGGDPSLLTPLSVATIKEFCERARILWHQKRNTRNALSLYFLGLKPPPSKADIIKFLLEKGADVNYLDDAARTPVFWATQFRKTDPSLADACFTLEKTGGSPFVSDELAVSHLRNSILEELKEKMLAGEGLSVSAIDLTVKSDWNLLGRLLYWARDYARASVAFEVSSVYDPTLASKPPVYHFFFCDICTPGDYRNETLIRGYRYVVRDALGRDMCHSCHSKARVEDFRVPSRSWIAEQQHAQEAMEKEFEHLKMRHADDAVALENAKKRFKKDLLIAKRDQMLEWLRAAAMDWESRDIGSLVAMYRRADK